MYLRMTAALFTLVTLYGCGDSTGGGTTAGGTGGSGNAAGTGAGAGPDDCGGVVCAAAEICHQPGFACEENLNPPMLRQAAPECVASPAACDGMGAEEAYGSCLAAELCANTTDPAMFEGNRLDCPNEDESCDPGR